MEKNIPTNQSAFLMQVAAIFEENCLPLIDDASLIEKSLVISSNYCLDNMDYSKRNDKT